MKWSMMRNDFLRNKTINLALLLFMTFSASLAVLSVMTAVQTVTSISALYTIAQPPHFLQMHKGAIDQEEIQKFMAEDALVTYSQVNTMIDIYGDNLTVVGGRPPFDLSDCRLDIGLVKQNATKDLLVNSRHEKVILQQGEMGIPVLLREMYGIEVGDHIILASNSVAKEFVVVEIILDSMMNSPMVSSTRILLADSDFEKLVGTIGENEYLIEAYFCTPKQANAFKTAYEDAGLPQNGQAITYSMIFTLSAFTDITMVFVLLLVSILLIIVSFICVKFTIMATLEEEVREIGIMKAIGLTFVDIRDLYLNKYRLLAFVGVVAGYGIAWLLSDVVTKHISTTFGTIRTSTLTVILSLAVGLLVFLLITYYCKKVLKRIKKLTVVDALVSGKGFAKGTASVQDGLHTSRRLSVNVLMPTREVFTSAKSWILVFSVVVIAVLMIMVPVNLLHTFEAPDFITYMGSSLEDILIEVENGEMLEENYAKVKQVLDNDNSIKNYYEYRTTRVKAYDSKHVGMNLDIDSGDMAGNGLQYLSGVPPEGHHELAVSFLTANELEKEAGDILTLVFDDTEQDFVLSGIYQDVTSGGITAKAKHQFPTLVAKKYSFSVNLKGDGDSALQASAWADIFGSGVTVDPMEEFIDQTLGGIIKQLRAIVFAICLIGASLVMLITALFLKLRLAKDLSEIAILKAIGFSSQDLKKQYMIKMGWVSLGGILVGTVLTGFLGEKIVNAALGLAGIGIKKVHLITNPIGEYIMCPVVLMALIIMVTALVMRTIEKYTIISIIQE